MIECKECACLPVCKEVDNYKEYKDQYLGLRNKSSLFDEDPKCPYYINKLQIIHNKEIKEECTCSRCNEEKKEQEDDYYLDINELVEKDDWVSRMILSRLYL